MSNEIEILKVYAQKDEDGFVGFDWEGKGGVNIWFMIGVLESIKQDLLREGEKLSEEKQW